MATICDRIRENRTLNDYFHRIPAQIILKSAQGFTVTAVISLIAGSTLGAALVGGALAVAATIINALARPLLKSLFPENPFIGRAISLLTVILIVEGALGGISAFSRAGFNPSSYLLVKFMALVSLNADSYDNNVALAYVL